VQRAISASWARVETAEVRAGAYGDDSDDDVAPPPPLQRLTPAEPVPPEAPVGFANLIGVKFHSRGVIHEFDCGSEVYQRDDIVLVEGERGGRLARVAVEHTPDPADEAQRQAADRMFANNVVLRYQNTEEWYEVHPAVRKLPKLQSAINRLQESDRAANRP